MQAQKTLIYNTYWDVLVILDACRHDWFERITLDWLKHFEKEKGYRVVHYEVVKSAGSNTQEWFIHTFDRPMPDVVYVSANPYIRSGEVLAFDGKTRYNPSRIFKRVINVWRFEWRLIRGVYTVPPAAVLTVVDVVDILYRDSKLIVHFLQPHAPYPFVPELCRYFRNDMNAPDWDMWSALQKGEIPRDLVIKGYVTNLRWVTSFLIIMISKFRKHGTRNRIVITADHGELFGEYGLVDHPAGVDVPELRHVPWCVVDVVCDAP